MFHLIIVDDEDIALQGLAEYVDWKSMGYEVVGTAHCIDEALKLLENNTVHVLLTDIQLEEESGLDLVGILNKDYPQIRSVILSGHNEFEYARQALRYGTFDFLTKPVQFDALRRTFVNLAQQLQQDNHEIGMRKEYLELKRARLFNSLAKEQQASFDPAVAQELGIETEGTLSLARIRLEGTGLHGGLLEGAKQKLRGAMAQQFDSAVRYEVFNNTINEYAVIFYNCAESQIESMLIQLEHTFSITISIGISRVFFSLAGLSAAYFEAGKAMEYCFLRENSSLVFYSTIQDVLYKRNIISEELELELNNALTQKDLAALIESTEREMEKLAHSGDSMNSLYSFCIEFHLLVDRFLRNYLADYSGQNSMEAIREIILRDNVDSLRKYNKEYILSLKRPIAEASPYISDTIQSVQRYIQEHYSENITLQTLANQFFLHPNYLSKLFQEKTGRNFIDYLTQVRIENAKELLQNTDFRIYDICEMVGYESPKYFSKVFKELTGLTPKEHRDANKKE